MSEKEFKQPQTPDDGNLKKDEAQKKTKSEANLYDINEVKGGFEVTLPGFYDKKRETIMGTSKKQFETKEEAEQVAERARESVKEQFERMSLEKTFTKYFYSINQIQDGKFRVVLPGAVDSKTGYYIGATHKDFETWQQAKEYFLQQRENEERLTQKPLLEIQTNKNEKIAFSDLDSFNPRVAPSEKSHEIPVSIEKYLLNKEKIAGTGHGALTYQETIKETDWERKLYYFISSHLERDGAEMVKQLRIEHLDSLTPKQAIELATQIVVDLTKYKWSDTKKQRGDLSIKSEKTKADQSTVLQLLREGQLKRNDPTWEGNGVCRNFASSVKAVFEALKANQTKFSRLRDTYCLYENGAEAFAPKRGKKNVSEIIKIGHAWNTFVTISRESAANAVIVDTTWAKRNLETKKVEGLDYTLTRMEPSVNAIGQELQETAPDKEEQLKHILSFYMLKMEKPGDTGGFVSPEEEKQFYATRALELMTRQGVPQELPKPLVETIGQEYLKIADDADRTEIETIYKISQNNPDLDFRNILRNYLKNKELSNYHANTLIFGDVNLQRSVFEELKTNKDFYKFLKESPAFRVRMREVLPQLFIDFSPTTKPEDMEELIHLIENSHSLRYEKNRIGKNEEEIKNFFTRIRTDLMNINPVKYQKLYASLDDCQLIKQYDRIEIELSEENPKNELWEIYRTVNEDGLERLPQMMNQAETELSKIAAEIGDDQFRENLDWLLNNNNRIDLYHITAVVNGKPYDRADDEMDINKARQFLAYRKIQAILLTAGETDHIDASRLLSDFIEKNHTVPYLCNTAVESLAKSNIPEAKKKLFEIVDDPKYGFETRTRAVLAGLREEIQFESTKVIALLNEYVESLGEDLCQSIGTYNIIEIAGLLANNEARTILDDLQEKMQALPPEKTQWFVRDIISTRLSIAADDKNEYIKKTLGKRQYASNEGIVFGTLDHDFDFKEFLTLHKNKFDKVAEIVSRINSAFRTEPIMYIDISTGDANEAGWTQNSIYFSRDYIKHSNNVDDLAQSAGHEACERWQSKGFIDVQLSEYYLQLMGQQYIGSELDKFRLKHRLIEETNAGHPWDGEREFIAELGSTLLVDPEKIKKLFDPSIDKTSVEALGYLKKKLHLS